MSTKNNWQANGNEVHDMKSPTYGECVCICEGPDKQNNAKLFAAAPDLLESLTWLFGQIKSGELVRDISKDAESGYVLRMMQFVANLGKAQAAIAKARTEPARDTHQHQ